MFLHSSLVGCHSVEHDALPSGSTAWTSNMHPQASIDEAIINPPRYKETYLWPKDAVVSDNSSPPDNGNKIIGSKAVTEIGIASVIHHIAIQTVDAKIALASRVNPSGWKKLITKMNDNGPDTSPIFFVLMARSI